ncbi:unnamed protein product, partial [Clonostachys solani]
MRTPPSMAISSFMALCAWVHAFGVGTSTTVIFECSFRLDATSYTDDNLSVWPGSLERSGNVRVRPIPKHTVFSPEASPWHQFFHGEVDVLDALRQWTCHGLHAYPGHALSHQNCLPTIRQP